MDISSCSTASSNASIHGYNLRKRSIPNYFPTPSKRAKTAVTSTPIMTTAATVTPLARPIAQKERKIAAVKVKAKKFPHLVKEELFELDDYCRRSTSDHKTVVKKSNVHVHELPTCVMSHIFKLLTPLNRIKVERVCRRWNFISRSFGWNSTLELNAKNVSPEVDFTALAHGYAFCEGRSRTMNGRINAIVNRAGKYLENVNFSHFSFLDYKICNMLRLMPRVHHLDLSGILLTNSSLSTIGNSLPGLKFASFRRCFHRTQVERGMSRLLAACRQLETLDVSDNEYFAGEQCFAELPPSIRHLRISHSYRVGDAAMAGIQQNCTRLLSLVMDRVDLVSSAALNALFEHLPELETLQYGDCFNNSLGKIEVLSIGKLKNLKNLTLFDNAIVTEGLLNAIGRNCLKLEKLDVSSSPNRQISDQGLRHLANLPKLSVVNFSGMRQLSDLTLHDIASNGQLKELLLHRCYKITDESITYVLKKCKRLRMLDVSYCTLVTDTSAKQLIDTLNALHGKSYPPTNCADSEKFCFSTKRSGITSPISKNYAHPWLKVMNELDYDYMLMGHLIPWTTFTQFPWMLDV